MPRRPARPKKFRLAGIEYCDQISVPENDFYTDLDEEVRPLVAVLRQSGINTVGSCLHNGVGYVQFEGTVDVFYLKSTLEANGFEDFEIEYKLVRRPSTRRTYRGIIHIGEKHSTWRDCYWWNCD